MFPSISLTIPLISLYNQPNERLQVQPLPDVVAFASTITACERASRCLAEADVEYLWGN